jgi:hypothetical protein
LVGKAMWLHMQAGDFHQSEYSVLYTQTTEYSTYFAGGRCSEHFLASQ